ncbi:hypothetical protein C8R46DRAFT_1044643 [Mycena filopes]|nr:hypothetical protein C8R46DRAFT_1044643 [Mycena filopes]
MVNFIQLANSLARRPKAASTHRHLGHRHQPEPNQEKKSIKLRLQPPTGERPGAAKKMKRGEDWNKEYTPCYHNHAEESSRGVSGMCCGGELTAHDGPEKYVGKLYRSRRKERRARRCRSSTRRPRGNLRLRDPGVKIGTSTSIPRANGLARVPRGPPSPLVNTNWTGTKREEDRGRGPTLGRLGNAHVSQKRLIKRKRGEEGTQSERWGVRQPKTKAEGNHGRYARRVNEAEQRVGDAMRWLGAALMNIKRETDDEEDRKEEGAELPWKGVGCEWGRPGDETKNIDKKCLEVAGTIHRSTRALVGGNSKSSVGRAGGSMLVFGSQPEGQKRRERAAERDMVVGGEETRGVTRDASESNISKYRPVLRRPVFGLARYCHQPP